MTLKEKIIKEFGSDILRRSALNLPNGAEDIKYFMTKSPVDVALEIGTFRGITSALMSCYCKHLITIDLKHGQYEHIKNSVPWADTPARGEVWKELGIDNIAFFPVTNNDGKRLLLKEMDFDFAFIDGDHSYDGVKLDFELTKKCGRVLFHDYDKAPGKACPVRDFINSIKEGNLETTKDFAYWTK